jgi:hypothetical protein
MSSFQSDSNLVLRPQKENCYFHVSVRVEKADVVFSLSEMTRVNHVQQFISHKSTCRYLLLRVCMKKSVDLLLDIPCFKCVFWKSQKENQLLCKPVECEELNAWLLSIIEGSGSVQVLTCETIKRE